MTHTVFLSNTNHDLDGVTSLPGINPTLSRPYFQQVWPNDKVLVNETKAEVSHGNI